MSHIFQTDTVMSVQGLEGHVVERTGQDPYTGSKGARIERM